MNSPYSMLSQYSNCLVYHSYYDVVCVFNDIDISWKKINEVNLVSDIISMDDVFYHKLIILAADTIIDDIVIVPCDKDNKLVYLDVVSVRDFLIAEHEAEVIKFK